MSESEAELPLKYSNKRICWQGEGRWARQDLRETSLELSQVGSSTRAGDIKEHD